MEKHYFYTWRLVKIWKKEDYVIEAKDLEEAKAKMKATFSNDDLYPGYEEDGIEWYDGNYADDEDFVEYNEHNDVTYELWHDDDNSNPIITNKPIDVIRDENISKILGEK